MEDPNLNEYQVETNPRTQTTQEINNGTGEQPRQYNDYLLQLLILNFLDKYNERIVEDEVNGILRDCMMIYDEFYQDLEETTKLVLANSPFISENELAKVFPRLISYIYSNKTITDKYAIEIYRDGIIYELSEKMKEFLSEPES